MACAHMRITAAAKNPHCVDEDLRIGMGQSLRGRASLINRRGWE